MPKLTPDYYQKPKLDRDNALDPLEIIDGKKFNRI